ncbi:MAG TPA: hypothetical protein VFL87_09780 [Thermoleophilaceae bacterium]|nr:hypothetical protein [Thermoleophilaceae bacterium]
MQIAFARRAALVVAAAACAAILPQAAQAGWLRGVNLNAYSPGTYGTPSSDASLKRAAADGANSVEILVTWYSPSTLSSQVAPDPSLTPSDAAVLHAMQTARSLGLSAVLKPQVNIYGGAWRGAIRPLDRNAWFASYQGFIDHYALLAQQGGASMLVVGDELKSMSGAADTGRWESIIGAARQRFAGRLTYAANFDEYQNVGFWPSLDYIGVDAYFPLSWEPDPSVPALVSAWSERCYLAGLEQVSALAGKPVLFTEIGYRSRPYATASPGVWNAFAPPDPQAQANAYEAAYEAFAGQPWFAGMYWWNWPAVLPASGQNSDYPPVLKPAEGVMSAWNAKLAAAG